MLTNAGKAFMKERITRYVQHMHGCPMRRKGGKECNCGLLDVIAALTVPSETDQATAASREAARTGEPVIPHPEAETSPEKPAQWKFDRTIQDVIAEQGFAVSHPNAAGEVEPPCARCNGKAWVPAAPGEQGARKLDLLVWAKPCPDCEVEIPCATCGGTRRPDWSNDYVIPCPDCGVETPGWAEFFAERKQAGMGSFWLPPEIAREMPLGFICGMVCTCGPNLEPLACGYKHGHDGEHAWASLPTFVAGEAP
jgi:hypothetical protein